MDCFAHRILGLPALARPATKRSQQIDSDGVVEDVAGTVDLDGVASSPQHY